MNKLELFNNQDFLFFKNPAINKQEIRQRFYIELIDNCYRIKTLVNTENQILINFFKNYNLYFENGSHVGAYGQIKLECNEINKNLLLSIINDTKIHDLQIVELNDKIKKSNKQVYENLIKYILSLGFSKWKKVDKLYSFPEELKEQLNMLEISYGKIYNLHSDLIKIILNGFENNKKQEKSKPENNLKIYDEFKKLENDKYFRLCDALYKYQYENGSIGRVKDILMSQNYDLFEEELLDLIEKVDDGMIDHKIFRSSFHYTEVIDNINKDLIDLLKQYFYKKYQIDI